MKQLSPVVTGIIITGGLLLLTSFEFIGDLLYTRDTSFHGAFWPGLVFYILIGIIWGAMLIYRETLQINIAAINAIWQVLSLIVITILSYLILKERTHTVAYVGMGISGLGLILVVIGEFLKEKKLPIKP